MKHAAPPPLTPLESEFIEEVGLYNEKAGQPRMCGRLLGYLLICDPPTQSFDQLAAALGTSKASISTSVRLLMGMRVVQRVARPGDRREYISLKLGTWEDLIAHQLHELTAFRRILNKAVEILEAKGRSDTHALRDFVSLHELIRRKLPELLAEWKRSHTPSSPKHAPGPRARARRSKP